MVDKYSSVTTLDVGLSKQPKDKFEVLLRWAAGLMVPLCFLPLFIILFSGETSGVRSALWMGLMVGIPLGIFAIWGNAGFAGGRYGNIVSPKMIWFAVVFALLFFIIPSFCYIFLSKQ